MSNAVAYLLIPFFKCILCLVSGADTWLNIGEVGRQAYCLNKMTPQFHIDLEQETIVFLFLHWLHTNSIILERFFEKLNDLEEKVLKAFTIIP